MSTQRRERLPWEYADGPQVGPDVPITSEPRGEHAPGVPSASAPGTRRSGSQRSRRPGTEERVVRAGDPQLAEETNQRVTDELREVVGADRVQVPRGRPRGSRGEHPQQHGLVAALNLHGFQIVRASAIVLTFAAIVALVTNDWWILPLAAGVHAVGTMTVMLTIIRMTTISERPSPELAAALSEEGVHNPDEYFSRAVEEYRTEPERGASEVISPGFNERRSAADRDTAEAAAEQSSAMTPSSQPSRPGGEGAMPDVLIWTTALSLLVLSIVLPAVMGGGWMWLLTAVMAPLVGGWIVMQRALVTRGDQAHVQGRAPMVAIVLCTAAAVVVFCAVVAIAFQH